MIPTLDPQVKYVGSSWLRGLNAEAMKALSGAVVVQDGDAEPMIVILPYETYLRIQEAARAGNTLKDISGLAKDNPLADRYLDAVGPELSPGRGKVSTETYSRGPRQKGDKTR